MHQGMTSSDVLDTCFNVQLGRAADLLIADVEALSKRLKRRAREHKFTPTIGRSHGIHAEPTTFGFKLAVAYAEFDRAKRLIDARKEIATCAISGAVGTFAQIDPRVEAYVAQRWAPGRADLNADHPARPPCPYFATLGARRRGVDRLATEFRHLQRTEVLEVEEFFRRGPKRHLGHAAQAQPDPGEKVGGLARIIRASHAPRLKTSRSGTNGTSPIRRWNG